MQKTKGNIQAHGWEKNTHNRYSNEQTRGTCHTERLSEIKGRENVLIINTTVILTSYRQE